MQFTDSFHVNFTLAAEFREKVKRTKDDFGAAGEFFSCETLRGIYDFPVSDPHYFEKESFEPLDVLLIDGIISMKSGRIILQPKMFRSCEGDLMQQAEKLIEFGFVHGKTFVSRDGYERREDGAFFPRIECKGMGFQDKFIDDTVYKALPSEKSIIMQYTAQISLDTLFERRDNNLQRRPSWVLTGQHVEPLRPIRRTEKKED